MSLGHDFASNSQRTLMCIVSLALMVLAAAAHPSSRFHETYVVLAKKSAYHFRNGVGANEEHNGRTSLHTGVLALDF